MTSDALAQDLAPKQSRSRRTWEQVVAAAEAVVVRDGVAGLTMLAVAEESGVSVGGIYRRFANKRELLHAVKDRMNSQFEQSMEERLADSFDSIEDVVRAFIMSTAEGFQRRGEGFRQILLEGQNDGELAARGRLAVERAHTAFIQALDPFIPAAADRLEVRMVAELVVGALIRRTTMGDENSMLGWGDYTDQLIQIASARLTSLV